MDSKLEFPSLDELTEEYRIDVLTTRKNGDIADINEMFEGELKLFKKFIDKQIGQNIRDINRSVSEMRKTHRNEINRIQQEKENMGELTTFVLDHFNRDFQEDFSYYYNPTKFFQFLTILEGVVGFDALPEYIDINVEETEEEQTKYLGERWRGYALKCVVSITTKQPVDTSDIIRKIFNEEDFVRNHKLRNRYDTGVYTEEKRREYETLFPSLSLMNRELNATHSTIRTSRS